MHDSYQNPLCARYAGREMQEIFSDDVKFSTWRRLWISLARAERSLGIPITEEQIAELEAHETDINYEAAAAHERKVRHDVMANVLAYGEQCPGAKGIIHLGATSCFVGDNTDIILMRKGLIRIRDMLVSVIRRLKSFSDKYKDMPTLAYTHFQPAQPTTVGKRASLWLHELIMDLEQVEHQLEIMRFPGCKGTTGTGASFLALFGGDYHKVAQLERLIADDMGFEEIYPVGGQTYSRKVDYQVLSVLSGIAQSASKFAGDIRLLSHLKEVDEPFESDQIGSSAMAYKRNPMRSERIASLSRYVIINSLNPAVTAATQWFERTLDDSANRRISIPEAFLATDGVLSLYASVVGGLRVYPESMLRHLREELPFMATENILMHCVKKGGDRQKLHELIRRHSIDAGREVKEFGRPNDLLDRILGDKEFGLKREELDSLLKLEDYIGLAPGQTEDFLNRVVRPLLEKYGYLPDAADEIRV